jgi:hypothetical protein
MVHQMIVNCHSFFFLIMHRHESLSTRILSPEKSRKVMALRQALRWSEGEVMRPESKPCSRLMRQTAGIFSVGGALAFWVLCRLHYGHNSYPSNSLLFSIFVLPFYEPYQLLTDKAHLLGVLSSSTLSKSEVRPFCCLIPCLSCRSKNNSSKEPQVGVMRSNLNELNIIPARAALQPGVRTAEYSSF